MCAGAGPVHGPYLVLDALHVFFVVVERERARLNGPRRRHVRREPAVAVEHFPGVACGIVHENTLPRLHVLVEPIDDRPRGESPKLSIETERRGSWGAADEGRVVRESPGMRVDRFDERSS